MNKVATISFKGLFLGILVGFMLGVIVAIPFGTSINKGLQTTLLSWQGGIIDSSEIIQTANEAPKLIQAMDNAGIARTILTAAPNEMIFYQENQKGFSGYEANNAAVIQVSKNYPNRFLAVCTVDIADPDRIKKIEQCSSAGAKGVRLYSGHSFFYRPDYPLDREDLMSFYRYLQEQQLPLIFNVNLPKYKSQFENVLRQFPKLQVICPHFCVASNRLAELGPILDKYPNLYLDIGFGNSEYLQDALDRIKANPAKYRDFIIQYQDRILFGTHTIVNNFEGKTSEWLSNNFQTYRNILEKEQFAGLQLPSEVLEKIYQSNVKKIFTSL